jgi:hypothetical protein
MLNLKEGNLVGPVKKTHTNHYNNPDNKETPSESDSESESLAASFSASTSTAANLSTTATLSSYNSLDISYFDKQIENREDFMTQNYSGYQYSDVILCSAGRFGHQVDQNYSGELFISLNDEDPFIMIWGLKEKDRLYIQSRNHQQG